jgi:Lrp/AsnC family transcriptional regulator, leucine-responsive regulatory protein
VHAGQRVDARDGERERRRVAPAARTRRGQRDHRKELDRRHGRKRQAVDCRVEAAVHGGQHGAPPDEQATAAVVKLLDDAGVITGYRAEIDPRALGYALSAIVRVRPAPQQLQKVAQVARDTPEVVECHRITGEDCYFIKAHVRSVEHLEEVIDRFTAYGQTTTSIMQSSPVPLRSVALP